MGPILAGIFGSVIEDKKIRNVGIRVELWSLFLCVLIGFIMGLIYCPFVEHYQLNQFPTTEMVGRGRLRNLVIGWCCHFSFTATPCSQCWCLVGTLSRKSPDSR